MALTIKKIEFAADGSVVRETLLPHLCYTKNEAKETARREGEKYPEFGECAEHGYLWVRDTKGRKFRLVP